MKIRALFIPLAFTLVACVNVNTTVTPEPHNAAVQKKYTAQHAIENLNFAVSQYSKLISNVNNKKGLFVDPQCIDQPVCIPRSEEHHKIHMVHPEKWVVGFYPGVLWMLLNQKEHLDALSNATTHKEMLSHAINYSELLLEQAHRKDTHDLGFMIDAPLVYALQNTSVSEAKKREYQQAIKTAERNLLARYSEEKPVMKSWDFTPEMSATQLDSNGKVKRKLYALSTPWQYPVIVDNMLNMEILMKSSDEKAREMAFSHADATMKNHYYYEETDIGKERPIAFHVFDYNEMKPGNWQGLGNISAWARGQGWGLYGYVVSTIKASEHTEYAEHKEKYEQMVESIFQTIKHHTQQHPVPLWDFFASRSDAYTIASNTNTDTAQYSPIIDLCLPSLPDHSFPYQGYAPIQYSTSILSSSTLKALDKQQGPSNEAIIKDGIVRPCGTQPYYLNEREIPRDTSAAAVYAAALYKMAGFLNGTEKAKKYESFADEIMLTLTQEYRTDVTKDDSYELGFVLESATGNLPNGSEVDTPIVYGDYYFIEANLNKLALVGK